MENKVQKLLQPRYEVIADYPGNPFFIGDIVDEQYQSFTHANKYPAIFRKLSWWEKRELNDLPLHLSGFKSVKKVVSYEYHGGTMDDNKTEYPSVLFEGETVWCPIWMYKPATETDYLTFINKKKV